MRRAAAALVVLLLAGCSTDEPSVPTGVVAALGDVDTHLAAGETQAGLAALAALEVEVQEARADGELQEEHAAEILAASRALADAARTELGRTQAPTPGGRAEEEEEERAQEEQEGAQEEERAEEAEKKAAEEAEKRAEEAEKKAEEAEEAEEAEKRAEEERRKGEEGKGKGKGGGGKG